jgi:hypothetical protein
MRPNGPGKVETAEELGSYGAHAAAAESLHYPLALVGLVCEALFPRLPGSMGCETLGAVGRRAVTQLIQHR